ncbi:MAG: hypothetical protein H0X12_06500, partial [Nocardioides sp.]|nr:hypothetical protein [Nocardioides sp.]
VGYGAEDVQQRRGSFDGLNLTGHPAILPACDIVVRTFAIVERMGWRGRGPRDSL